MFSKYEGIADITLLSRIMLGKSMNSIPLLMNRNFYEVSNVVNFRINIRTKSTLSMLSIC